MRKTSRLSLRSARASILLFTALVGSRQALADSGPEPVPTISGTNCDLRGDAAVVSFKLEDAFGSRLRKKLEGGLTVTFTHEITLSKRRGLWFPRVLVSMKLEVSASLDMLTQRFALTRTTDAGQSETVTTDRLSEAESWLSEVRSVRVTLPAGSAGGTLDLKVRSVYGRDNLLFFYPWPLNAKDRAECR